MRDPISLDSYSTSVATQTRTSLLPKVFGLLGLLIAFTFSGAATRFDDRRHLVRQEANIIGTAWLRLDLLPDTPRENLRNLFRRYLDSRLETYDRLPDLDAFRAGLARSGQLQNEIWSKAVAACRESGSTAAGNCSPSSWVRLISTPSLPK